MGDDNKMSDMRLVMARARENMKKGLSSKESWADIRPMMERQIEADRSLSGEPTRTGIEGAKPAEPNAIEVKSKVTDGSASDSK